MGYHRKLIAAFSIGLCWFSLFVYLPILPAYARDLGASYEMVGMIVGIYGLAQMTLRLPLGIISDRLNKRKRFVVAGLVLCFISGAGLYFLHSVAALLLFRSLAGLAATTWVVHTVLYMSYFQPAESGKAIGLINAIAIAGQMIGTLVGGYIAYRFDETYTFLVAAAGGLTGLLLSLFISEETVVRSEPPRWIFILEIGRDRLLLAFILQALCYGTIYGFIPIIARKIGANNFELGLLPSLFMLPGILASVLSGTIFSTKLGVRNSLWISFLLCAAAVMAIPWITDMNVLYLSQMLAGFGQGLSLPMLMELGMKEIEQGKRATAMGFLQTTYGAGMFAGPAAVGFLAERLGLDWGFWLISLAGIAGALTAAFALPRFQRKMKVDQGKDISI